MDERDDDDVGTLVEVEEPQTVTVEIVNEEPKLGPPDEPPRVRMPPERSSVTHKFTIVGGWKQPDVEVVNGRPKVVMKSIDVDGYIVVGLYPDGRPGEIFLTIGKQGGQFAVYDELMTTVSVALQYGIPLKVFLQKFEYQQYDPSGVTNNPDIPFAKSIVDYIMKWMKVRFGIE